MAIAARTVRRRRPFGTIFVLLLIAAGLAYVLIPLALGHELKLPFSIPELFAGSGDQKTVRPPRPGYVRVLVSGRDIPRYTKITRDDLWDPEKDAWAYLDISEETAEAGGVLVDARDIVGRVLDHDKTVGYAFTESDFVPKGTRPGFVAGIPAGKRALRIDVEKVHGIVGLQPGDRFDILAALPVGGKSSAALKMPYSGVFAEQMNLQTQLSGLMKQARVDVLVQNGVVVSELQNRQVPITNTSLTRGTTVRTVPKQEMIIALEPGEVAPLMESIAIEADIQCVARSGRPDDPLDSVTPSSEPELPWGGLFGGRGEASGGGHVIEAIAGGKRELVPVPPPSEGLADDAADDAADDVADDVADGPGSGGGEAQ